MVATFKEGIDVVIDLFKEDWNRANTDNFKPVIIDIADTGPEKGKRIDLRKSDYVLVFETAHNEEIPDILYDFVTTRINITNMVYFIFHLTLFYSFFRASVLDTSIPSLSLF